MFTIKLFEATCNNITKYMAIIILATSLLALFWPASFLWTKSSWIVPLLMLIMLGMGLTIKIDDFKLIFLRPKDMLVGCVAQFTIMPLTAYGLGRAFDLDPALMVGVVLVGTCPGGTASNVITYLAKGDVALSVGMTSVNTLLAPILTPFITYQLLKATVKVDMYAMFMSIVQIVILPLVIGFVLNKTLPKVAEFLRKILPAFSVIAISLTINTIVAHSSARILATGGLVFTVVILHNLLGIAGGFVIAKALGLPMYKTKALAIEIGMQNSGLAASLATTSFPNLAMATVPGAIFSVWHNLSGAIFAAYFRDYQ